eukprot:gene9997-12260_t
MESKDDHFQNISNCKSKIPDLYEFLGVEPTASEHDIKKAYKRLARLYHPDKNPGSDEKFKELNAVYEILSNPQKKSTYDLFRTSNISMPSFYHANFGDVNETDEEGIISHMMVGGYFGGSIGMLYSFIAICTSIIFSLPLTTVFFPSLVFFVSPIILTRGSSFSKGFAIGGVAGILSLPVIVASGIFLIGKSIIETPIKYLLGYKPKEPTVGEKNHYMVLDETEWEFINKQKIEYEKIDDVERNWTFLSVENSTVECHINLFIKSIENIKCSIKVITDHYNQINDQNSNGNISNSILESELIFKKLSESILYIQDIENMISIKYKEDSKSNTFSGVSQRVINTLDESIKFVQNEKATHQGNMKILTLVKNIEIFLEEYVFNSFEYYQI